MEYTSLQSYYQANWRNSHCKSCRYSNKIDKKFERICPQCKEVVYHKSKGSMYYSQGKLCQSCSNSGENNPFHGKTHTEEHKLKCRERAIFQMEVSGPAYNKQACKYFDKLNLEMGWSGQHAENGGEIIIEGYFVDFYDAERNIVVEYDEPHHEKPSVKKKDRQKERIILKSIGCEFYRFSEKYNKLYKVT